MITDSDLVQEKGEQTQLHNIMLHYVQTITFLFLLSIWSQQIPTTFVHLEKKLWQKILLDRAVILYESVNITAQ